MYVRFLSTIGPGLAPKLRRETSRLVFYSHLKVWWGVGPAYLYKFRRAARTRSPYVCLKSCRGCCCAPDPLRAMSRNNRPPAHPVSQSPTPTPSTTHPPNHVYECSTAASVCPLPPLASSTHPRTINPSTRPPSQNSTSCDDIVGHVRFYWPYSGCATATTVIGCATATPCP